MSKQEWEGREDHPDYKEDTPHNGLMCWINPNRECGADCMAYTKETSESSTLCDQQKSCVLLVTADRLGRYMGHAASAIRGIHQTVSNESADRARQQQTQPPSPRGNRQ